MKNKNTSAFTLIEIMVVVTIIALISVIGIPAIRNSFSQGSYRVKEINIASVEAAKEQWALLNNKLDGTSVTWENIEDYMGYGIDELSELDVNGDTITINVIGTQASY